MSVESPAAPTVAADADDWVAGRVAPTEPETVPPESASMGPSPATDAEKSTESASAEPADIKSTEATVAAKNAETNGHDEGNALVESEIPEVNGTPASAKKSASARRKSTGGASSAKKLGKKKSQQRITHLNAQPGEYYLARLKSFPPWPAIICDEEMLPQTLLSTRPVTTKQADGTYKDAYADGGKRVYERTFPIMFLETNEFAWIPNMDLTPLDPETCKDVSEKGKQKHLIAAYKVAAENHDLQYFKNLLADHQRAVQQEADERDAKAAEKAAAKARKDDNKKKRKSNVAEDVEDIEMGDADEEENKKLKSIKKRKKDAESDAEAEKPAKTPKTTTKLKLTTPKTPGTAEPSKKAPSSAKPSKPKKSAKNNTSEEETAVETPKEAPKPIDPQEAKAKKEKEILFIRHKLQKGFISRDQAPKEEEMAAMSNYITKLESHNDLEVSIIRATKINKVLKAIIKLNSIPKDEEYQFRRRSVDILAKWKNLLESDIPVAGSEEPAKESKPKPKTNGIHKEEETAEADKTDADVQDTEEKSVKAEDKEASASKDEPMPDADTEAPANEEKLDEATTGKEKAGEEATA